MGGGLMWIARIAQPEAIYAASATARTFPEGRIIEENEESGQISEIEEDLTREKKNDFWNMPRFTKSLQGKTNGC